MAHTHHNSPLALTYARSLLELANEKNQAEEIGRELAGLGEILAANPGFRAYLADPAVGKAERNAAVEKIFRGRVSPLFYNFLGVVNGHGRLSLLGDIASAYANLLDAQLGNVEVDVTSAQKLTPDQLEQVRQRVSQALGKNARIRESVDDSILGGLVVQVGDRLIDASVASQLRAMKHQLLTGFHRSGAHSPPVAS
ncbi:MAG: atpH [Phycisphaerales bacterium]|nr:atpH [Phycisphaerales bacterium]